MPTNIPLIPPNHVASGQSYLPLGANLGDMIVQQQEEQRKAERQQQLAAALMGQGYVPNSGRVGVLASLASALAGARLNHKADESMSAALRKQFDISNAQAQAAREQQLADERRKLESDVEKQTRIDKAKAQAEAENRAPSVVGDLGMIVDARTGKTTAIPGAQDFLLRRAQAGKQSINVSTGEPYSPFEKALAVKDAETYQTIRDQAMGGADTLQKLDALQQITNLQKTGKAQEAMATIGQYFGTDAGANMQAFNKLSAPMILSMAQNMKGALSDKDIAFLKSAAPSFGNDPRANQLIIDTLRKGAQASVDNLSAADAHIQKYHGLQGFKPAFNSKPIDTSALPSTRSPTEAAPKSGGQQYNVGQIVNVGGKRYRVTGGDPTDPNLEEVR